MDIQNAFFFSEIVEVKYEYEKQYFFTIFEKRRGAYSEDDLKAEFEGIYPKRRYVTFEYIYPELKQYA